VLPFGLALNQGITLAIDEQETTVALGFSTCLPAGCLVPIGFATESMEAIGAASRLNITATISDSGDSITLTVNMAAKVLRLMVLHTNLTVECLSASKPKAQIFPQRLFLLQLIQRMPPSASVGSSNNRGLLHGSG